MAELLYSVFLPLAALVAVGGIGDLIAYFYF